MKAIEIENVSKIYKLKGKLKEEVIAVSNANLDIEEGEILGLLGPNGAGKTTLIKLILGLIDADNGRILINGYDVAKSRKKALKEVGALVEEPSLFADYTGLENLRYYAKLKNSDISQDKIMNIVELVGLKERINSKFKTYSLGMKQRLGIAQALMDSPKILLLDEPTNGLDPSGIVEMRELFLNLKNQLGVTIIISSHILSEMQELCDRVAFMSHGEIKAVKTMQEVAYGVDMQKKYAIECSDIQRAKEMLLSQNIACEVQQTYIIVRVNTNQISDIIKYLVNNDISIYGLTRQKRRLEDLYKEVSK